VGLRVVEFSAVDLPHVQAFDCGDNDWSLLAARWIKSAPPFPGALKSIEDHGNAVWLYFLDAVDEEFLVGFTSLGQTRWPLPPPDGPRRNVGFIPMLAVASAFQGKPTAAARGRYVDEMLEHLIEQALRQEYRELCLFVHKDNQRAIRLYERYGFAALGTEDDRGNLKMLKLLD